MNSQMYGYPPGALPPGLLAGQQLAPQGYDPYAQYQQQDLSGQLAPQGFFGDLIGKVGAPVGGWIGSRLGNQGLGQQIGGIAGQLGRLLPFEAGPQGYDPYAQYQQQQQYQPQDLGGQLAPQGFFGDLIGKVGAPLGGAIGSRFGNRGLGQQIGGIAGQLGRLLPFEAGPQGYDPYAQYQQQQYQPQDLGGQLAPQGFFGDLIGKVGAPVGGWIGGRFGNQGLGQQIGGVAGQLGRLLPFEAGPQGYDPYAQYQQQQQQYQPQDLGGQLAPQGFFGDLIGKVGAPVGGWIGGRLGNQGLGQQIGGIAGQLGRLLPFEAGPQGYNPYGQYQQQYQPQDLSGQLAPQGFIGDLIGKVGAPVGGWIGGRFGNQGLGQQIGGIAGQLGRLLPFEAGPQGYDPYAQYQQQQQQYQPQGLGGQLAPQGFIGDLIGKVGAPVGGWIGGRFGNQGLGQQIGGIAGQLGRLLPFEAAPQLYGNPYAQYQQQDGGGQLAPQGFLGGLAGSVLGGLGGGAIGKLLGNRNLGQNIGRTAGGVLGGLLPFEAGPQYAPQGLANVPIYQNYGNYPYGYQG